MSDLQENEELPKWVVYEFSKSNARIYCQVKKDLRLFQDLPARLVRMLEMLQQAYDQDKGLPSDLRGFRHRDQLAKAYDDNPSVEIEPETMTHYVSELVKRLKSPAPSGGPFPKLIVREKGKGARLTAPVRFHTMGGEDLNE